MTEPLDLRALAYRRNKRHAFGQRDDANTPTPISFAFSSDPLADRNGTLATSPCCRIAVRCDCTLYVAGRVNYARLLELLEEAPRRFEIALAALQLQVWSITELAAAGHRLRQVFRILPDEAVIHAAAVFGYGEAFDEMLISARRQTRPRNLISEVRRIYDEIPFFPASDGMTLQTSLL